MDLIGAPHILLFPEQEGKKENIRDSVGTTDTIVFNNLLEAATYTGFSNT